MNELDIAARTMQAAMLFDAEFRGIGAMTEDTTRITSIGNCTSHADLYNRECPLLKTGDVYVWRTGNIHCIAIGTLIGPVLVVKRQLDVTFEFAFKANNDFRNIMDEHIGDPLALMQIVFGSDSPPLPNISEYNIEDVKRGLISYTPPEVASYAEHTYHVDHFNADDRLRCSMYLCELVGHNDPKSFSSEFSRIPEVVYDTPHRKNITFDPFDLECSKQLFECITYALRKGVSIHQNPDGGQFTRFEFGNLTIRINDRMLSQNTITYTLAYGIALVTGWTSN